VDGREVHPELPARPIPLDELRTILLEETTGFALRNAALAVLIRRAKQERGAWVVGLAGVLLPGFAAWPDWRGTSPAMSPTSTRRCSPASWKPWTRCSPAGLPGRTAAVAGLPAGTAAAAGRVRAELAAHP